MPEQESHRWEQAVEAAIEWCDTYDQQSDAHTFDAAELAGSARAVMQRIIDEIRLHDARLTEVRREVADLRERVGRLLESLR